MPPGAVSAPYWDGAMPLAFMPSTAAGVRIAAARQGMAILLMQPAARELTCGRHSPRKRGMAMLHIVLLNPEIPQNTGNIARTCAATGARLELIKPLGFEISDKYLKRAGLDYWHMMEMRVHESWQDFLAAYPNAQMFFTSKKARACYCDVKFPDESFIVFGRESCGLPEELIAANYDRCLRIPMREGARSLNLSNSAAIMAYEYLRQHGFAGLEKQGSMQCDGGAEWRDYL